jgi:hypothetical protein
MTHSRDSDVAPGDGHQSADTDAPVPASAPSRRPRVGRIVFWLAVMGAVVAVLAGVPAVYVFGPLLALFIIRMGLATFDSLEAGAAHIPDSEPEPIDPRDHRTTYWCGGCGAELLLTVRGTPMPPRHCGERMTERTELAREAPPSWS